MRASKAFIAHRLENISKSVKTIMCERIKDGDPIAAIARDIGHSQGIVRAVGRDAGLLPPAVPRK